VSVGGIETVLNSGAIGSCVLKRENDNIGKNSLNSVKKLLREEQIEIKAEAKGGF
jgi:chemotaxis receptor (MCP) glutamine deamidase CheD